MSIKSIKHYIQKRNIRIYYINSEFRKNIKEKEREEKQYHSHQRTTGRNITTLIMYPKCSIHYTCENVSFNLHLSYIN